MIRKLAKTLSWHKNAGLRSRPATHLEDAHGRTQKSSGDGKLHDGYGSLSDGYDVIHDQSPWSSNAVLILISPIRNFVVSNRKTDDQKNVILIKFSVRIPKIHYPKIGELAIGSSVLTTSRIGLGTWAIVPSKSPETSYG